MKLRIYFPIFFLTLISLLPFYTLALDLNDEKKLLETFQELEKHPGAAVFTPPSGWRLADPTALPKTVKVMVVGKGSHEFPPSINLGMEPFNGTLKQYLEKVKAINASKKAEWKNLGTIQTRAGNASLSQLDTLTPWGKVCMMHVILIQDQMAYILTAASLKDEFSKFYDAFFKSFQSFRINKS